MCLISGQLTAEAVLDDYGVKGEIVSVRPGPVVTMYELEPAPGLKASRVIGLADDDVTDAIRTEASSAGASAVRRARPVRLGRAPDARGDPPRRPGSSVNLAARSPTCRQGDVMRRHTAVSPIMSRHAAV